VIYAVPAILLFAIAVIIKYDPAHTSAQYLIVRACLLGHAKQPAAVQQSAQADLPESGRFWNVVAVLPSCHRESSCTCSAGGLPHAFGGRYGSFASSTNSLHLLHSYTHMRDAF